MFAVIGGVVVAGLGAYCGPDFGWNVLTRKSERCDRAKCAACDVCVLRGVDFSAVRASDLAADFAPCPGREAPLRRGKGRT